jgi:hypothetical protein
LLQTYGKGEEGTGPTDRRMESIRRCDRPDFAGGVMRIFQKFQPNDVFEWLVIATKDLVAPAKKRIVLEVEAHYAEVVAAHLANNLSKADAEKDALAELGDAREAGRRFRRQHLTEYNAKIIKWTLRRVRNFWQLLGSYLLFLLFFLQDMGFRGIKLDYREFIFSSFLFYVFVVDPTAGFVMVRRKSQNIGFFFLMQFVTGVLFICLGCFFYGFFRYWAIVVYSAIICFFLPELYLWFKFRHVSNVWDEIPSLDQ